MGINIHDEVVKTWNEKIDELDNIKPLYRIVTDEEEESDANFRDRIKSLTDAVNK